jgi:hypothetical protein
VRLRVGLEGSDGTSSAKPPTHCGGHFGELLVFDSCGMSTAFRRQSQRRLDAGLYADSTEVLKGACCPFRRAVARWPADRFAGGLVRVLAGVSMDVRRSDAIAGGPYVSTWPCNFSG